jgi:hypothetical protein
MIDYDNGVKISAGNFIQDYNAQVGSVLTVSQEFKDEVTPVLERVLSKRGIGLTDEQYLMYLWGKDIAAKGIIFFQMKQQTNYMLENIKQASLTQSSQPRQEYTPPPSQPPAQEPRSPRPTPPNDPTPKSRATNTNDAPYTNFPPFETDEEINERESRKDMEEEDEYIFKSKMKNQKGKVTILESKPKRPRK